MIPLSSLTFDSGRRSRPWSGSACPLNLFAFISELSDRARQLPGSAFSLIFLSSTGIDYFRRGTALHHVPKHLNIWLPAGTTAVLGHAGCPETQLGQDRPKPTKAVSDPTNQDPPLPSAECMLPFPSAPRDQLRDALFRPFLITEGGFQVEQLSFIVWSPYCTGQPSPC